MFGLVSFRRCFLGSTAGVSTVTPLAETMGCTGEPTTPPTTPPSAAASGVAGAALSLAEGCGPNEERLGLDVLGTAELNVGEGVRLGRRFGYGLRFRWQKQLVCIEIQFLFIVDGRAFKVGDARASSFLSVWITSGKQFDKNGRDRVGQLGGGARNFPLVAANDGVRLYVVKREFEGEVGTVGAKNATHEEVGVGGL